ncbi:hypothetical protein [Arthrobacter sp. U41]|uniref:hypothetical protein n=1 Tax=Arthrobacter sp. U41 TaxID=1849032 RepID=UPI001C931938|nr:hypothetical protein [Arthrobacter sp. U41]
MIQNVAWSSGATAGASAVPGRHNETTASIPSAWNSVATVNLEIATVAVWILGSLIMESAMMNSFQLWMKVRIAVVKTPGGPN